MKNRSFTNSTNLWFNITWIVAFIGLFIAIISIIYQSFLVLDAIMLITVSLLAIIPVTFGAYQHRRRRLIAHNFLSHYLSEAQNISKTGSFGWNSKTNDLFWSEETYRIFGYPQNQPPTIDMVMERVHPDDAGLVTETLTRAKRDGHGFDIQHRLLMPDGEIRHVRVVAHRHAGLAADSPYIGAVSDITSSRETFIELERSEQRYRDVFQHMPIGLLQIEAGDLVRLLKGLRESGVTDLGPYIDVHPDFLRQATDSSTIMAANDYALRMFGATAPEDVIGRSPTHFWEPSFDTAYRLMVSRFRGEPTFAEETKLATIDGRIINVILTIARSGAAGDRSLAGIIEITDRVRVQEMLTRLQADFAHASRVAMLGELTASIAHEVNQPLAAIAANGEATLRQLRKPGSPDLEELREATESIVNDARRAADVISRIRSMAARKVVEHARVQFSEVVREALLFLSYETQKQSVAIAYRDIDDDLVVEGDKTLLQQVIVNLSINATQAMALARSERRQITIRAGAWDADTIFCSIEDSGPGIPDEHRDRLFESFFTTKAEGMGMGLAICRSIVEAHGGSITAGTSSEEGGACFTLRLPRQRP